MGGWEFYTEASIITQVLRKTNFFKERGMLGPYTTSVALIVISATPLLYCCAHVVPILLLCPIEAHYCYYYALTILLLCRLSLYCDLLDSYI